ncbi:MAG: N-acetylmuramoyl-L-alanine amidase [Bacteroidales bacterium]
MTIRIFTTVFGLFLFGLVVNAQGGNPLTTIVIDPGHGGKDLGASRDGVNEKDITLSIAKLLKAKLEARKPEINVTLTREDDVLIPLHQRAEKANEANADLFISLHVNASDSEQANGIETYVLGLHKSEETLDAVKKENTVIMMEDAYVSEYDGFDPSSSESYIVFELLKDEHIEQSIEFASCVQKRLPELARMENRGVKQGGFLLLKNMTMPSVLVEMGFVSNKDNCKKMIDKVGQHKISEAIYESLFDYANSVNYEPKIEKLNIPDKPIENQYMKAIEENSK